ncbi:MAG: hypothetical protein EBX59_05055, partial [Betaproteobacteria bacterium]|nr:hypothetical protein [Betaproteobacteria bacterium]
MVIDFDEKEKFVSQRKQCLLAKLQNHMLHHISLGLSALSAQRPFVTPCSSRLAIRGCGAILKAQPILM